MMKKTKKYSEKLNNLKNGSIQKWKNNKVVKENQGKQGKQGNQKIEKQIKNQENPEKWKKQEDIKNKIRYYNKCLLQYLFV